MQRGYDGVYFYGQYHRVMTYALEKAVPLLDKYDETKNCSNINEILELYGICRALGANNVLPTWDDNTVHKYRAIGKKIQAMVGRFAAGIDDQSIASYMKELDVLYIRDFLDLIEHYSVYKRICGDAFSLILNGHLADVLRHKRLVAYFGAQIADYMFVHSESGALLVKCYLLASSEAKREQFYIPGELTSDQRESIIMRYVESGACNLNMLHVLQTAQGTDGLSVSDVLRLKAKRRCEKEINEHFAKHPGIGQEIRVGFASGMKQAKEEWIDKETHIAYARYSRDWVIDNQDYPTLLNNFIYLFGYTDISFRSSFPALKSQSGLADQIFQCRGMRNYPIHHSFRTADMLFSLQMAAYRQELNCLGIELEDIFRWFFETYLPDEFGGVKIRYNTATKGVTALEKIRMIAPELEGALKQYLFYCKYGEIDLDLLSVSTQPVIFSELPSMQTKKYVYTANDECRRIQRYLFSEQSWLPGKENEDGEYTPFGHAVMQGLISTDDLGDFDMQIVQELKEKAIIMVGDDGVLSGDPAKMAIYQQLYDKEVICYQYCGKMAPIIDAMANRGEVKFGSTLFSVPEQHYLNFVLNNKEYSNGLCLRNKYTHSGYPQDQKQQEEDYFQLLKVTVLAIIKINEEFCLRFRE